MILAFCVCIRVVEEIEGRNAIISWIAKRDFE